ncbi:hypothetical protein [Rhizobium halophytocola]|uniref:Nitrogen fixation protein n=1 Tax=Rhizobium halophytocola TaxID=735519 RepID=A0ABS4DXF3_9HYPH|nr:hypothetical protein [Rhizobium halophytocola]MBP1850371.1 hypothetical protein [Rhizobium halophytocola]
MRKPDGTPALKCPSAQPDMTEAEILGVVEHGVDGANLAYLNAHQPVTPQILAMTAPAKPLQVLRFAARCEESRCTHFDGQACRLASRIVAQLDPVTDALPPCVIRRSCRWYAEQGGEACRRCPQVMTEIDRADPRAGQYRSVSGVA